MRLALLALLPWAAFAQSSAPTAEECANATISGLSIASRKPVTLVKGRWDGKPDAPGSRAHPFVMLSPGVYASGDLDGDGKPEAVVIVHESGGGSGVFSSVVALRKQGSRTETLGIAPIGDRVQIRGLRINNDQVQLDTVQTGEKDGACCPGDLATRYWKLTAGKLKESGSRVTGRLSTAALEGTEWKLSGWGTQEAAPDKPEATIQFQGDRIAGLGGCNRYMGNLKAGSGPGEIIIQPVGSTMMACPTPAMEMEKRFTTALGTVNRFGFFNGQLALTYRDGTLLFRPIQK